MQNSSAYNFLQAPCLQRETSEDMSKIYTTLFDNDDMEFQQGFIQQQQYQQQHETQAFIDALLSPTSPASSCFSASSPLMSSVHSSPAMMDTSDTDDLMDVFNLRIQDLLAQDPLMFQYSEDSNYPLFASIEQNHEQHQHAHDTPCPSSEVSTPTTQLPNTDGMTVIKSDDGSIMVFNPTTESMTFRCEHCPDESYGRIHDLKRHQASKHQAVTWPCEFCNKPFARRDALLRHFTVKSTREDGIHPAAHETERLMAARSKAKLNC